MRILLLSAGMLTACARTPVPVGTPSPPAASSQQEEQSKALCPAFASWDRSGTKLLSSRAVLEAKPATIFQFFASWCAACGPQLRTLGQAFPADSNTGLVVVLSGERYGKAKGKLDAIEAQLKRQIIVIEDGSKEVSRLFGVCEENQSASACQLPAVRVCHRQGKQLLSAQGNKGGLVERIRAVLP
ncbi:MAG: hypothetical protein CMH58_07050 [Myxococcales bacterium]|nr:hypothetical protein [Myxococcales bacterium]